MLQKSSKFNSKDTSMTTCTARRSPYSVKYMRQSVYRFCRRAGRATKTILRKSFATVRSKERIVFGFIFPHS